MNQHLQQESTMTKYESDCIRFYMGDPEVVESGMFRGGPKAYNTINALLHKGIADEEEKIAEGKVIELQDADHLKQYLSLICSIYAAMLKYKNEHQESPLVTYRIDRAPAIQRIMDEKRIEGFYSTCKRGYLEEYAHTKTNIVLLEIHRKKEVPYLDFEELFRDYYAKPQEAEILLPFHALVERVEKAELTEEELSKYTDMHEQPPAGKYRLWISAPDFKEAVEWKLTQEQLFEAVTDGKTAARVQKCMEILMKQEPLQESDEVFYKKWKEQLHMYIAAECSR